MKVHNNLEDLDLGRFSEKIHKLWLTLNDDGTYDYDGSLNLESMQLKSLKEIPIRFRRVNGFFSCSNNKLTSLEGAPLEISEHFNCYENQLISLQYSPLEVGGTFHCSSNQLTSLEGAPLEVGGHFWCSYNKLTSLQYSPSKIGGTLGCFKNKLISLQYAPSVVNGGVWCDSNNLLSKECLSVVQGEFIFKNNTFSVSKEVIRTVKQMTYEQQMAELKFFDEHDINASKMFQEVLDSLGVKYGTHRKEMRNIVKDLNLGHLGI
jgi:hypothetical protein